MKVKFEKYELSYLVMSLYLGLCLTKAVLVDRRAQLKLWLEELGARPETSPNLLGTRQWGSLFEIWAMPVQFDGHQHVLQKR